MEPPELLQQLVNYFPWYVALVLVPAIARAAIERAAGIPIDRLTTVIEGPRLGLARFVGIGYDSALQLFVLTALYFPLFEELVFRGFPYIAFGTTGAILGSIVWIAMHPAWQMKYFRDLPLRKKILFTLTSSGYYSCCAAFYTMMWLAGAGLAAIIYHMAHNAWITGAEIARRRLEEKLLDLEARRALRAPSFVSTKRLGEARRIETREATFVKPRASLSSEVEEMKRFMFVRRRGEREGGG